MHAAPGLLAIDIQMDLEMPEQDAYASIAEFYDLEHDAFDDDVAFYLQYVESAGDPVLELACGTGRVTIPIASAGFRVVGADSSVPMLSRARDRGRGHGVEPIFVHSDMKEARTIPGGPFGVVIMALGALSHLTTIDDQIVALSSVRQALDPRGVLLLDMMHASPGRLQAMDGAVGFDGRWQLVDGSVVDRFSSHAVYPATQTIDSHIWYDHLSPDGTLTRKSSDLRQRYVSPGELTVMLMHSGFEEVVLYGGYELEPFEDSSERIVIAAEATRTR